MTVRRLKRELENFDENLEVVIAIYEYAQQIGEQEYDYYPDLVEVVDTDEGEKFLRISSFNNLEGN
jgi:hypothetical protein